MNATRTRVLAGGAGLAVGLLAMGITWAAQPPQEPVERLVDRPVVIHQTSTVSVSTTLTATSTALSTLYAAVTTTEYVDVTEYVNVPTTVTDAVTVVETVTAAPTTAEAVPAPVVPANWMEELRPQVDLSGLGVWLFEKHPETGSWGTTDGYTVWIDPNVPEDARWSVMVHEYAHLLQRVHYGSLDQAEKQSGDMESLADCMALQMGADFTAYGCDEALVPVANQILGG